MPRREISPGDDANTAEAAPGRVGKGEQGEARRANSTLIGGPLRELARLQPQKPGVKMTSRLLTKHLTHHP